MSECTNNLWAHREADIDHALKLIEILEPDRVIDILRYLVGDYWGRYLGWPDLLPHRGWETLFAKVKSSSDPLSGDQKDWIASNHDHLGLPFSIVKFHQNRPRH